MSAHQVRVAAVPVGSPGVELPDGITYQVGATPTLTDEQFSQLGPNIFTDGTLVDLGEIGGGSGAVTLQGAAVTLTSATNATAAVITTAPTNTSPYGYATSAQALALITLVNSLQITVNALVVDVAALNTNLSGTGKALV
jgi:hypothetical protein